jgi:hypothetical protein
MSSGLYDGDTITDYTTTVKRIDELLPSGLTTLNVFYPGTATIPWALTVLPNRATTLNYTLYYDISAVANYQAVRASNPSGIAAGVGYPVPFSTRQGTYRNMYNRFIRAGPNLGTSGDISVAINTFMVNWGSKYGYPGEYGADTHQSAADSAQALLATQATSSAFNIMKTIYLTDMSAMTVGDYVFIDVPNTMSYGYQEIGLWYPILTATPCNWIVRCNGEPDIFAWFQGNSQYTIETLSDGISVLIRNF